MAIDIERCKRGMKQLDITGTPRPAVIEQAIAAIQASPAGALLTEYFGIKNYAGFGDQREDHQYGYGPKHGSIVFKIGRTDENRNKKQPLDADAIYLLEAYRDFAGVQFNDRAAQSSYDRQRVLHLCAAIRMLSVVSAEQKVLADALSGALIEANV